MFKLNPVLLGLVAAQGMMFPAIDASAVTLRSFTPQLNDNRVGVYCLCNGRSQTLRGIPRFAPGISGETSVTLEELQGGGRIINDNLIGAERLEVGQQNYDVTIPDAGGGTSRLYQVYNTAAIASLPTVGLDTVLPDYIDVNDAQYINARVATVRTRTLTVDIGRNAATSSATNGWSMAAKQSELFTASGRGHLNWNSSNRITFTAATPPYAGDRLGYSQGNVVAWSGVFTVTTLDGNTSSFNVTNPNELRSYNDWLIDQLSTVNLSPESYNREFSKAFSLRTGDVVYRMSTDNLNDEVARPLGNQVVMSANGRNASVKINAGKTLEVVNSNSAAMRAGNGATAIIAGKLASTGPVRSESKALELTTGSRGYNNGVINGGFFNRANGTGVDSSTLGYIGKAVSIAYNSRFTNNGVINLAIGDGPAGSTALWIGDSRAVNNGNINVGVAAVTNDSSASGVAFSGEGSFINAKSGTLYIGRTPQNNVTDPTTDVAVNLGGGVRAIDQILDSRAINNGHIVIGSLVQNAVGMQVEAGPNATTLNNGVIDVNGRAQYQPLENVGMLAIDSGSGGRVGNNGTINLNGDNGTALKVLAREGNSASAFSTGPINVNGEANAFSGTFNTAVWASGQEGGVATADISGPIHLYGESAIGIRAEGDATVNLTAEAIPQSNGSASQITFLAIGPDASINLPANGSYAAFGSFSTIFRYQDGADFDGSGITIKPSASLATGVMGSGAGTDINSHNATFNIGPYSTGIAIEGGARGTIVAATTLNMNGISSTAARVDGDKHDLRRFAINPVTEHFTNTLLVNHADINGIYNWQTGLEAINEAQLINTGDINLSGETPTGIVARYGATATNSGDISVTRGGVALYADGYHITGYNPAVTQINNSGTLNVTGRDNTNMLPTWGVVAYNAEAFINQNGMTNLYGGNVIAGEAFAGGAINLGASSSVVFHNANQTGYLAHDVGSRLIGNGGSSDVTTEGSTLYRISNGASFDPHTAAEITLSGANSNGLIASDPGTVVYGTDVFTVNGSDAVALRVSNGAQATLSSPIALNGDSTIGAVSDASDGIPETNNPETTIYAASQVTGSGANVTAFQIGNGGTIENQGSVDLTGPNSTGASMFNGSLINRGSIHVASGIGINVISGINQYLPSGSELRVDDGIAALRVGPGGRLRIVGDGQGSSTLRADGSADALLLDTSASQFRANDITLGAYGGGTVINNRAETEGIFLQNVLLDVVGGNGIRSATSFDPDGSALIHVSGGGTGYLFANEDSSLTHLDMVIGSGYDIVVSGEGTGIRANTTGRVISQGNITIEDSIGGSAIVTRTASEVINQGTIASQSVVAPIVDLRGGQTVFINQGTITAPNPATVVVAGGATSNLIALLAGRVVGDVNTGDGSDSLLVTGGTLNGSLTMGSGARNQAVVEQVSLADTSHITTAGGEAGTLNLSEIEARGGSFTRDNLSKGTNLGSGWSTLNFLNSRWTLTDNIKLAHSTINIDSGSTLFAGGSVNPVLQGATDDSLIVNNAGTLDLTNGGDAVGNTLTIDGDLISAGGRLRLNSAATQSDALRVNGNVSGTTVIGSTLTGAMLADSNNDRTIDATEGVSLAQVSGNASARSFTLQGGYLASGPWQYSLYNFAPGSSDASQRQVSGSGNGFWDYRLANTFVCEDGSLCQPQPGSGSRAARPAVTPQLPSYLSTPLGLAYYQLSVTDDLHKRLGELRHQLNNPDAPGGEMFIRYLGSNLTYQSNRSFSQYGYDFDLDYSAVQLGANLLRIDGAQESLRGGVAYTRGNTRIRPKAADGYSSTTFDSDSVALYGIWQRDSGFYLDGSLSWNWHRGETDIAREKEVASPKGDGWTASLESGYPLAFAYGWRLEPQAQLTYLRLKMDDFTDRDGARVSYDDYNQTIGRVGARLDRTWQDDSQRQYTPYIRTNYYHGWGGTAKMKVGSTNSDINQSFDGGRFGQMWDVGLGGTTTFKNDVSLYAEADYRKEIDGNGAKGWRYNAGVRWSF